MPVNPHDAELPEPGLIELVPVPAQYRDEYNPFRRREASDAPEGEQFRVGELSRRSGVAVGTIKFYLREGLLQPGEATAKTQALYSVEHLRRLRIIRVLSEVGGLSIAKIRAVVERIDDEGTEPGDASQAVSYALAASNTAAAARRGPTAAADADAEAEEARRLTDEFLDAVGFVVAPDSPARAQLAEAFLALRALGLDAHPIVFTEHARLAYELARFEVGGLNVRFEAGDPAAERQALDEVVVGTVVFGAAFMALRAMAHEHEARRMIFSAEHPPGSTRPSP